jgi:energy-coupling factor transporter ATP-binding protein EcfA2
MIETLLGYTGYETTIETAYTHLKRGRSVIFTGTAGCGKTSLIESCAEIMAERKAQSLPMVIEFCNPPKQFVLLMIGKLYRRKLLERELLSQDWDTLEKRLSRLHVRHSVKIALKSFYNYPGLFVGIDDLDFLTPTGRSIVLSLTSSGATICGAATKRTATLKRVIYQFQEIPVPPMRDSNARKIAEEFIKQKGALVENKQHFVENIVLKAAGNILALDNMLRYFEHEPRIRTEDVRKLSQGAGRKEVSIEWIIYAAFAFVVMLRFVSRATMNKQLYIITSVIAALFIIMRYILAKGNRSETT